MKAVMNRNKISEVEVTVLTQLLTTAMQDAIDNTTSMGYAHLRCVEEDIEKAWVRRQAFAIDVFRKMRQAEGLSATIEIAQDNISGVRINVLETESGEFYYEVVYLLDGAKNVLKPPSYWEMNETVNMADLLHDAQLDIQQRASNEKGKT